MYGSSMFPVRRSATPAIESEKVLVLREKGRVEPSAHVHTWQDFVETIVPDNPEYRQGRAKLIVKACTGCHIKRNINMRIERNG